MSIINQKSELLFLYETKYSMPNGDPFTGEQRYDEETKRVLVSDVRMKRFIRDYWDMTGRAVYVSNPDPDNKLTAGQRFKQAFELRKDKNQTARDFVKGFLDVRAFGAVVPIQKDKKKANKGDEQEGASAFNLTGPIQFALLNPSLNKAELRMHQNTSQFVSKEGDKQGTIGTTSVVPYALCQIHGWVNPFSARHTGLSEDDLNEMFAALWHSVNNANTRTKSNQSSLLLLQIVYREVTDKLYGVDKMIQIKSEQKNDEQLRGMEDFELDLTKLKEAAESEKVAAINFYTEYPGIEKSLQGIPKMQKITLAKLTAEQ